MVQALPLCALLSLSMGNSLSGCSAGTIEAMVKKESIDASGCWGKLGLNESDQGSRVSLQDASGD